MLVSPSCSFLHVLFLVPSHQPRNPDGKTKPLWQKFQENFWEGLSLAQPESLQANHFSPRDDAFIDQACVLCPLLDSGDRKSLPKPHGPRVEKGWLPNRTLGCHYHGRAQWMVGGPNEQSLVLVSWLLNYCYWSHKNDCKEKLSMGSVQSYSFNWKKNQ